MSEAPRLVSGFGGVPREMACKHKDIVRFTSSAFPFPSSFVLCSCPYSGQAHEEAAAKGEGCAVLDGSLVERLHAENARRVIELHESIAALEAGQDTGV